MPNSIEVAIEEAIKWGIPAVLTAFGAWGTVKRKSIANWHRSRKAHREAHKAMVEAFPTIVKAIGETGERSQRMTGEFAALNSRLDAQDSALNELLAMNHGQFELSGQATFVCDKAGRNLMVNSAYARLLGVGRDDLMDFRYKQFMAADTLANFWSKFLSASADHLELEVPLWFTGPNRVHVCIRMVPHPRQQGPATHWVGTVTPCEEHP